MKQPNCVCVAAAVNSILEIVVTSEQTCSVAIVYATRGRPHVLSAVLNNLAYQTSAPKLIMVACTSPDDVPSDLPAIVQVIYGKAGLTCQRNEALRALPADIDVVVFFDDDFVPHPLWLHEVVDTFRSSADIVGVTGLVVADGIKTSGITFEESIEILERLHVSERKRTIEPFSPYGCNMAFRRSAIEGIWFDERLVLYGWQEDRDFGSEAARRGRVVRINTACGVHMGVKASRVSGKRFGYSQVSNPVYLWRKGNMTLGAAADHIFRNFCSNLAKTLRPEPFVDRPGRLVGNLLGFTDVLRGRVTPERAIDL